jgi:hypothetical protein
MAVIFPPVIPMISIIDIDAPGDDLVYPVPIPDPYASA